MGNRGDACFLIVAGSRVMRLLTGMRRVFCLLSTRFALSRMAQVLCQVLCQVLWLKCCYQAVTLIVGF
jgi:hypothetical protein